MISEKKCNELLQRCNVAMTKDVPYDERLAKLIEAIGESLYPEHALIFYKNENEMNAGSEWCRSGCPSIKDKLQHIPYDYFVFWERYLQMHECVSLTVDDSMKASQPDAYALFSKIGIYNLVMTPIFSTTATLLGYAGVLNYDSDSRPLVELMVMLGGFYIGGTLSSHLMNVDLSRTSSTEQIYKRALFSGACAYFEVDLTDNIILGDICSAEDGSRRPLYLNIVLNKPYDYTSLLNMYMAPHIVGDVSRFTDFCSPENLIALCRRNVSAPQKVFLCRTTSGAEVYYRMVFYTMLDPETDHFISTVIVHDVTETEQQKAEEERRRSVIDGLSTDYDSVMYVDLETGDATDYHSSYDYRARIAVWGNTSSYPFRLECFVDALVVDADKERILSELNMENIRKRLLTEPVFFSNFLIRFDNRELYYEGKIVADPQDRKNRYAILGFHSVDRETRARLRREEMHELELRTALEKAQSANHAKSTFLFNMSHDIRTPMNAIMGLADMATKHVTEHELVADYLEKINIAGNQLLTLINDVLDMSRIETDESHLSVAPTLLPDLFEKMLMTLREVSRDKELTLEYHEENVINHTAVIDSTHLSRVILNLLTNSVKYTRMHGHIDLILKQLPDKDGKRVYNILVSDNGIGMSKEYLAHYYEAFSRERNSTTSGIQGTGLGTAIAKKLITEMGGTIEVESEQGKGTTVTISISSIPCDELVPEPSDNKEIRRKAVDLKGRRILLVEDNELNQMIAANILEEAGMLVECAEDGDIAVDKLSSSKPGFFDLILMDIQMPRMNGYEATTAIRALPDKQLASIPIIAMTANAFSEDRSKAFSYGMNGHVAKPINVKLLFSQMKDVLGQQ